MTKMYIESAINGPEGSSIAYFFRGDQFVIYNWVQDRSTLGAKTITDVWSLPDYFQPPGFSPRFDAAISGHESNLAEYRDHSYFFRGGKYVRYDWRHSSPRSFEFDDDIQKWGLPSSPSPFAENVDAAFNGKFSRQGKVYFFKNNQYARCDWAGHLDYIKAIGSLVNMPSEFATSVDAAVDGDGPWVNYGYLFKGDKYIRFNWDNGGTNPHVDIGPSPIIGNWQGLIELLLAGEAKSKAFEWLWAAIPQLEAYRGALQSSTSYPDAPFMDSTLNIHFRIDPAWGNETKIGHLNTILDNFYKVRDSLHRAPDIFKHAIEDEYPEMAGIIIIEQNPDGSPRLDGAGNVIPIRDEQGRKQPDTAAYTSFGSSITFTKMYATKGPACRASQIIHEVIHYVDNASVAANDIPEWYVTDLTAGLLGLPTASDMPVTFRYDLMTVDVSIHNPSSYASFAQHIRYRFDTRYGERRQEPIPGLW